MIYSLCIYGRTFLYSTNSFLYLLEEINSKLRLSLFNLCNYPLSMKLKLEQRRIKKERSIPMIRAN